MTIHHATLKFAAKHGIEIAETDAGFIATYDGHFVEADTAKDAVAQMVEAIENETVEDLDLIEDEAGDEQGETEEGETEEGDEDESRSIVREQYRKKYRPHQDTCGDDISRELASYLKSENEAGEPCIDRSRLERFARANGFWQEKYAALNNGQARMNVGNRLRARIKKDPKFSPKWPA